MESEILLIISLLMQCLGQGEGLQSDSVVR
jgi:hypothetical protein